MRLLPTDKEFFTMLTELTARLTAAGELLEQLCADRPHTTELASAIKNVEHEADDITRRFNERLDKSFAPPFDREDLHALAVRLDNVIDLIDGTARRFSTFHIGETTPAAAILATLVSRAGTHLETAVAALRHGSMRSATVDVDAVKRLEEDGDAAYGEAVSALFAGTPDPLFVLKWKEIYDRLEDTLDECKQAALVVQSVALKHS